MKFNYRLSKICGTTYASAGSKHGANVLFYKDTSLLSPAGNRIHVIDLRSNVMRTLPIECRSNISCISVCEKTGFLIAVDVDNYAVLMKVSMEMDVSLSTPIHTLFDTYYLCFSCVASRTDCSGTP